MTNSEIAHELQKALDNAEKIAEEAAEYKTAHAYGYLMVAVEGIINDLEGGK